MPGLCLTPFWKMMHFDLPVLSLMRARLAWTWAAELEGLWWKAPYLVYRMQGKGGWGRVL